MLDPIEQGEVRCERWADENVDADGVATCSCGRKFRLEDNETLSSNPYAIPVCRICFLRAFPPFGYMFKWLFQRHITLPNPLWWLVAAVVYPSRRVKRRMKRKWLQWFPKPVVPNTCHACGKDIGTSLFGWCSIECLREMVNHDGR